MSIFTFAEKHQFAGGQTEQALLKLSWDAEIFGVGMFETLAEMYPQHAERLLACAAMEWYNVRYCEAFGHDGGVHVSLLEAEKLGRAGAGLARTFRTFESVAKLMIFETPVACKMYQQLDKGAGTIELKTLAEDLYEHENAMRDWFQSEIEGKSDGCAKVFAYLERHGVTREEAVIPRKHRENMGGDRQQLVLAFFPNEDAADLAAKALRTWDKASDYIKLDAIGVLVKDKNGKIKEHKLGRRAGRRGMGIGFALGVLAAIPTGGLSLVGGVLGGGAIGSLFHKGLKMTDQDVARIGRELDRSRAAVGVLTWDFETELVAGKLEELGGIPQTHEMHFAGDKPS